ncbi:unnamed protein product [Victoria cruziana]
MGRRLLVRGACLTRTEAVFVGDAAFFFFATVHSGGAVSSHLGLRLFSPWSPESSTSVRHSSVKEDLSKVLTYRPVLATGAPLRLKGRSKGVD